MATMTLADIYRAAKLLPTPEIIGLRQAPFETLSANLKRKAPELVRLYFGLPLKGELDWFLDPFKQADPSFSIYDNETEAAVLAAALLHSAVAEQSAEAIWAILAASFANHRKPVFWPGLVSIAS